MYFRFVDDVMFADNGPSPYSARPIGLIVKVTRQWAVSGEKYDSTITLLKLRKVKGQGHQTS